MRLHVRGTVLPGGEERALFVTDDRRLTFRDDEDARTMLDGGFLIPGLADAHCHLGLYSPAGDDATDGERARASARAELEAGVLALREPGAPNRASTGLGPGDGLPRTLTAGRMLAPPGSYVPGFAREVEAGELVEAILEELLAGGGTWAKLIGDWFMPHRRLTPNFPVEAVAEAAQAVHRAGGRIAVHTCLPETIDIAIEAGVDTIEHGLAPSASQAERMAAGGIAWTPTMVAMRHVPEVVAGAGLPAEEIAVAVELVRATPAAVRTAHDAGVRVLAGTDAGMVPHGMVSSEISLLHASGIPAAAALGAGSWDARSFLGLPGIEEGAPADLVGFARDPREDLSVLSEPALVVLDGLVVRTPERTGDG